MEAGRKFVSVKKNKLKFEFKSSDEKIISVDFLMMEKVGTPWTVVLKNEKSKKTIEIDFGMKDRG